MNMTYRDAVAAYKQCRTCGESKLVSAFGRDSRAADGLRFRCRACRKRVESLADTDFWAFVDTSRGSYGCWIWTGCVTRGGYGLVRRAGGVRRAHRVAWELFGKPLPSDKDLCHHCDNPRCVNPIHLFLGTERDNMRDMAAKGRHSQRHKTGCPQGHAYTPDNTSTSRGYRRCRQCDRDYAKRRRTGAAA